MMVGGGLVKLPGYLKVVEAIRSGMVYDTSLVHSHTFRLSQKEQSELITPELKICFDVYFRDVNQIV